MGVVFAGLQVMWFCIDYFVMVMLKGEAARQEAEMVSVLVALVYDDVILAEVEETTVSGAATLAISKVTVRRAGMPG